MIQRIQKIFQVKKLTPSAFADKIGVPRSTISHVLSGRNNPSLELVQKILDSFPDIRTEWLVRGQGNMLTNTNSLFPAELSFEQPAKEPASGSADDDISIPAPEKEEIIKPAGLIDQDQPGEKSPERVEISATANEKKDKTAVKTRRVVVFFSDGTFKEYLPAEED